MGRLSRYAQDRILLLRSEQAKVGEIVQKLSEEGISTTRQTVSRFLRVSSDGTKTRLNTAGEKQSGKRSKLKQEQLDFINKEIEKDDKLNARDLQEMLQEQFSVEVSIASIKRARKQLGWVRTGPRNVKVQAGPCQDHATIVACLTHITEQQQLIGQKLDRLENRFVLLQQFPNAYQLFPSTTSISHPSNIPNSSAIPNHSDHSNPSCIPNTTTTLSVPNHPPCGNDIAPLMPPLPSSSEPTMLSLTDETAVVPDSFSILANIYNLTTNDLYALSRKSSSIGNFSVKLVNIMFRADELLGRNCNGKLGKLPLDSSRLSVIKEAVYHIYSVPDISRTDIWKKCVIAIDESIRRPKSKTPSKKRPVYVQLPSMTDLHLIAEPTGTPLNN
ncbi:Hypothetical predicted protein [Paramuricea clavata]|uniref:Uncharacterized protein n=1 Tax=Paramuricea clavata TaxID=317549 RepID=A0A7D9I834_PARCT|nr:Hypothetical predicted protein [Paramuricea clavata]